jgi:hypothetical protein
MMGTMECILGTAPLIAVLRSVDRTSKFIRKEIPRAHGFRKFFTTQLVNCEVNPEIREMLLGHKIGLTGCYYRPTQEKMYDEYKKAIDSLTINEENRLRRKVKTLEIEKSSIDELELSIKRLEEQHNNR